MIRKQSKQRDLVLNYMKQIHGHVSAEEVYDALNQSGNPISLATVYRNLDILSQMNEIKKIAHPVNGYVYDKTAEPHYHLHCVCCNRLFDAPNAYVKKLDTAMNEQSGWHIYSHSILFEGVCPKCSNKADANDRSERF